MPDFQSKSLIKYEPLTPEVLEEMNEEFDELTAGDIGKIGVGKSVWRVLPGMRGCRAFVVVMEHYRKAVTGKSVRFVCPRHHAKSACPDCARAQELRASGHPLDYEEAGTFLPKLSAYCNAVNRSNESRGPQVLVFKKLAYNQIKGILADDGDFTNPNDGFDLIVTREGTKKEDTKYDVKAARDNSALHADATMVARWLEMAKDLRQYKHVPSEQEMEDMGLLDTRRSARRAAETPESPRRARAAAESEPEPTPARRRAPEPRARTVEDDAQTVEGTDEPEVVLEGELEGNDGFGL